ncbi:MAG: helix-turn-helix transcriptional regulator [Oscillospiraceae bacterium]|nr:helix-turn-helix transcriptional regulator [Oscillospiraceae bacterium]
MVRLEINERIGKLRVRLGLSGKEFGEKLEVKRSTVNNWETGGYNVKADDIVNICKTFGVSADWLLGLAPENQYSRDDTVKMISEYTGLSTVAVERLHKLQHGESEEYIIKDNIIKSRLTPSVQDKQTLFAINTLLENFPVGKMVLSNIAEYLTGRFKYFSLPPEPRFNSTDEWIQQRIVEKENGIPVEAGIDYMKTEDVVYKESVVLSEDKKQGWRALEMPMENMQAVFLVLIQNGLHKLREQMMKGDSNGKRNKTADN